MTLLKLEMIKRNSPKKKTSIGMEKNPTLVIKISLYRFFSEMPVDKQIVVSWRRERGKNPQCSNTYY